MAAVIEMEYTGAHETPTKPIILLFAHHYIPLICVVSISKTLLALTAQLPGSVGCCKLLQLPVAV
jgi:hypothetical protein